MTRKSEQMEQAARADESKMATEPVNRLMVSMGLPIVVSMMLQAVYNIVDSAFLSNMATGGEEALTATGLAFPLQILIVAIGVGTGVGANALLSKCLGQGDREEANRAVGNSLALGIIIYVVFLVFGLVGVKWYVNSQSGGGTINQTSLDMAVEYLQICCTLSFGIIFFSIGEKFLQATGRSLYSTIAQITGAVVNIVLDPLLIYGMFFFPELGVRGAAIATVAGQISSAVLALGFHFKLNKEVDTAPRYLRLSAGVVGEIYAIGLPAIISQALLTVMTYGMNIVLAQIAGVGESYVTVYGLYYKVQQMITFAAMGMRDTITPVVSYADGMGDRQRVREGIRYGIIYTVVLMAIGTLALELLSPVLVSMYSLSDTTAQIFESCLRIVTLSLIFAGISIAFQGVFQALGCGMQSLVVSLGRQLVFILPVAWAFVSAMNAGGPDALVWWTFLIGEAITLVCAIVMYRMSVSHRVDELGKSSSAGGAGTRVAHTH